MNVEIIKISTNNNNLDSTKQFGLFLNDILKHIKMMHWYTLNYNVHKILGKNHEKLSILFDSIQEEIIETSKHSTVLFPLINANFLSNQENSDILENYKDISEQLKNNLNSLDFNNYLNAVSSGINNTKEEILSELNKTSYLLSLVDF